MLWHESYDGVYFECRVPVFADGLELVHRLLEAASGEDHVVYENSGTWHVAIGVLAEVWVDDDGAHLRSPDEDRDLPPDARPLMQVRALLDALPYPRWRAFGWTAFELGAASGERDRGARLLHLVVPRTEVWIAASEVRIWSVESAISEHLGTLLGPLRTAGGESSEQLVAVDIDTPGAEAHERAVARTVENIQAGVVDKVVLSRVVPVHDAIDFPRTFRRGRRLNTPARSFLLSLNGLEALGFSPEVLVTVEPCGAVRSQPLAGTRPLVDDAVENARLRHELLFDPKEVFEHAVSVRVVREELANVCQPRSAVVTDFLHVQERGTVQHLASEVAGQLGDERSAWDAFEAVFPAVTVSGVPKPAATAHIGAQETEPRGLYGGAVLTVDQDGALDAALVLRTVFRQRGRTWLRAGGGIVQGSVPASELLETQHKLASVSQFLVAGEQRPLSSERIISGAPG